MNIKHHLDNGQSNYIYRNKTDTGFDIFPPHPYPPSTTNKHMWYRHSIQHFVEHCTQ